jgi:hypothetical protein
MIALRRLLRLIAILTTLSWVLMPLCALACFEGPPETQSVGHQAQAPCHGESPATGDEADPASHGDCDCELTGGSLFSAQEIPSSAPFSGLAFLTFLPGEIDACLDLRVARSPSAPEVRDLPPPDILLLKATLLI